MNRLSLIKPTSLFKVQTRFLSCTPSALGKEAGFDKKKIDSEESLMQNAPKWNEETATESEADVKADKEKIDDPKLLEKESAEWIKAHGGVRK
ncbi:unnamed protein product [Mucor hiemalis]